MTPRSEIVLQHLPHLQTLGVSVTQCLEIHQHLMPPQNRTGSRMTSEQRQLHQQTLRASMTLPLAILLQLSLQSLQTVSLPPHPHIALDASIP